MKNIGSLLALLIASASVVTSTPLPSDQSVGTLNARTLGTDALQVESRRDRRGRRTIYVKTSKLSRRKRDDNLDSDDEEDPAKNVAELKLLEVELSKADANLRAVAIEAEKKYEAADAIDAPDERALRAAARLAKFRAKASLPVDYDSDADVSIQEAKITLLESKLARADHSLKASAIAAYKAYLAAKAIDSPDEETLRTSARAAIKAARASISSTLRRSVSRRSPKKDHDDNDWTDRESEEEDPAEVAAELELLEVELAKAHPTLRAAAIEAERAYEAADAVDAWNEKDLRKAAKAAKYRAKLSLPDGWDTDADVSVQEAKVAVLEAKLAQADHPLKGFALAAYKAYLAAKASNSPDTRSLRRSARDAIRAAKQSITPTHRSVARRSPKKIDHSTDIDDTDHSAAEDAAELILLSAELARADPTLAAAAISAEKASELADANNTYDAKALKAAARDANHRARLSIPVDSVPEDDALDDARELAKLEEGLAGADRPLRGSAVEAYKAYLAAKREGAGDWKEARRRARVAVEAAIDNIPGGY